MFDRLENLLFRALVLFILLAVAYQAVVSRVEVPPLLSPEDRIACLTGVAEQLESADSGPTTMPTGCPLN